MNTRIFNATFLLSAIVLVVGLSLALSEPTHACGSIIAEVTCATKDCGKCRPLNGDPHEDQWYICMHEQPKYFCTEWFVSVEDHPDWESYSCEYQGGPREINCGWGFVYNRDDCMGTYIHKDTCYEAEVTEEEDHTKCSEIT